jgi:hypothetical protein
MLYTKAAIPSTRGMLNLGVKIDESSVPNFIPRWVADRLSVPLHFGRSIRTRVAKHIISTNQYCQFDVRVAGVETKIDVCIVSELPSLLLGREWIRQVNLMSDLKNHKCYIPGPYGNLIQVLDLGTATIAEIESCDSKTEGRAADQISAVGRAPTAVHEDSNDEAGPLDASAEFNESEESDTTSETIDND